MSVYKSDEEIIKLKGIEGRVKYFQNFYESGKLFFFKYRRAYQLHYSKNVGFSLSEVECMRIENGKMPYTKRGRFVAYNSKNANELVGRDFFLSHQTTF